MLDLSVYTLSLICFPPFHLSQCSVDCGVGRRTRSVRCVSDQGSEVNEKECNSRIRPRGTEECNMGPCVTNWYFTDWSNTVSNTRTHRRKTSAALNSNPRHDLPLCPSVFCAVWPRGAEEGGGVSDSRRSQGGRRGRGLCWG